MKNDLMADNAHLRAQLATVTAERDAAREDMKNHVRKLRWIADVWEADSARAALAKENPDG